MTQLVLHQVRCFSRLGLWLFALHLWLGPVLHPGGWRSPTTIRAEDFAEAQQTPRPRLPAGDTLKGELPWLRQDSSATSNRPTGSARELLVGMEPSQLEVFRDREPLSINEDEALCKVLYRISRFAPDTIQRYVTNLTDLRAVWESPDTFRFQVFDVRGRMRSLRRQPILPELAERLEFDHYWEATIELDEATFVVYARHVPSTWQAMDESSDVVCLRGMLLKVGDSSPERPQLILAASAIGWLPDSVDIGRGVTSDLVLLAQLGFDVSLFDLVRPTNGLPIGKAEREAFFQLLAAVHRAPDAFWLNPPADLQLAPLIQTPQTQHGSYLSVVGTARAVKCVQIEDLETQIRLGFDHYFEVDLLLPLGNQSVRIGSDGPIFRNNFPMSCCVLEIPDEWQQVLTATGVANLRDQTRISGFHYKLWGYQSEMLDRQPSRDTKPGRNLQVSPLLIGRVAVKLTPAPIPDTPGIMLGVICLVLGSVLVAMLGSYYRSDKRLRRLRTAKTLNVDEIAQSMRASEETPSEETPVADFPRGSDKAKP